jgi:hypothetical protein
VLAENGSSYNYGLYNYNGAEAVLRGGAFNGRGGIVAYGISNDSSSTTLEAESVTALGENGSSSNFGLYNYNGAEVTLRGASLTGRAGTNAYGIYNDSISTTLETESVTALGENGSSSNYGLSNDNGAEATLRGGSFTGSGGNTAYGIYNDSISTTLETESVTALGENGNYNYGLWNSDGAEAVLRVGSFTGRGVGGWGEYAYGIWNFGTGTTLEAESVTALGENGFDNSGLWNSSGAAARLNGGSFTGRGGGGWGEYATGIYNLSSSTTLEAEGVSVLGENGFYNNSGLWNSSGAAARLNGGSFTGRGGNSANGIYIDDSSSTLEAEGVSALGENGSINYGLYNYNGATNVTQSVLEGATLSVKLTTGSVTVSNSRLVGGAVNGTVTCVLVTRGTAISTDGSTCP